MTMEHNLSLLADIQATILKSHGRKHVYYVTIAFHLGNQDVVANKNWLATYADNLTTAADQINASNARKNNTDYQPKDGGMVKCMHLTKSCFDIIGMNNDSGSKNSMMPDDASFLNISTLKDSPLFAGETIPSGLDEPYGNELHVLIVIADNSVENILKEINEIAISLKCTNGSIGQIEGFDIGKKLLRDGKSVEHFGYQDGISERPLLDENNEPDWDFCKKHVFDKNFGTYMVFLKLEQNVKAFKTKVENISKYLEISEEEVGYQIFGRSKQGIPITHMDENGNISNLRSLPKSSRCPLHAHIRKADYEDDHKKIYIFRRGITYGERDTDLRDEPAKDVGLLFMSYQKSIKNQFEVLQERFSNCKFPNDKEVGIDPIMGQRIKKECGEIPQVWKTKTKTSRRDFHKTSPEGPVVFLKGGGYFYTPTISFLKNLTELKTQENPT